MSVKGSEEGISIVNQWGFARHFGDAEYRDRMAEETLQHTNDGSCAKVSF